MPLRCLRCDPGGTALLTMPDAEPVSVWEPGARTCECPAVLTRRVHQTRPGAEALQRLVDVGDVDEDRPRLRWMATEQIFAGRASSAVGVLGFHSGVGAYYCALDCRGS